MIKVVKFDRGGE